MKNQFESKKRQELSTLKAYTPGRSVEDVKSEYGLDDVIKLASNENPFGCPISSLDVSNAFNYPDQNHHGLLPALCKKHGLEIESIILGNGSDDILQMIALAFLSSSDSIVISETTFSVYKHVGLLMGAEVIEVPLENFKISTQGLLDAVKENTKCLFLANPNNPTGTFLMVSEIRTLLEKLPSDVILVLDEAYRDFVSSEAPEATEALLNSFPNLLILRTFSKIYGLGGFRIGYGIAGPALIQLLQHVRQPFNVNQLALDAALLALNNKEFIEKTLKNNKLEKQKLISSLSSMSLKIVDSEANFLCILGDFDADTCALYFMERGVVIRSLSSFGLKNGIRVTIGLPTQNERFFNILKEMIKI
jgi:histidinol-phosphate aminotransferase